MTRPALSLGTAAAVLLGAALTTAAPAGADPAPVAAATGATAAVVASPKAASAAPVFVDPPSFGQRRTALRSLFTSVGYAPGGGATPSDTRLLVGSTGERQGVVDLRDGHVTGSSLVDDPGTTADGSATSGDAMLLRAGPENGDGSRAGALSTVPAPFGGDTRYPLDAGFGPQLFSPAGEARVQQTTSAGRWQIQPLSPGAAATGGFDVPTGTEVTAVSIDGTGVLGTAPSGGGRDVVWAPAYGMWTPLATVVDPRYYGVTSWAPGRVGNGIGARGTPATTWSVLAFPATDPGSGSPRLAVLDDGLTATPRSVADIGARCDMPAPALSEDGHRLAYVRATGPVGDACSAAEVRILTVDSTRHFTLASADELAMVWPVAQLGMPRTLGFQQGSPEVPAVRLGGADRIAVAVQTSRSLTAAGSARGVVLTGSAAYADALTGGPLAARLGGPSLLTPASSVPQYVLNELRRVLTTDGSGIVYVVGGPASVSDHAVGQRRPAGLQVQRVSGQSRYDVAVGVARLVDDLRGTAPTSAIVTSGSAFADALVAGPVAVQLDAPVLLSIGSTLPPETEAYLASLGASADVYAIGGSGAGSVAGDPRAQTVGGATRYDVARNVAVRFFPQVDVITLVDGRNWPDAVSGGTMAARWRMPVALANGPAAVLDDQVERYRASADYVIVVGGPASVSDEQAYVAIDAAGGQSVMGQWVRFTF